jgi:transcriptional regulator with XRE-family HTH domain
MAIENAIKELRTSRGWSYAEVAKRVADDTSPSTIQKLEQGVMQLTPKWAEALARAFGVNTLEIYGAKPAAVPPRPHGHLAEDVKPYIAAETAAKPQPATPGYARYLVTSRALDELGLLPGMIVEVNERPDAAAGLATGDIVLAEVRLPGHAHATMVMREFVEPALLITNSIDDNADPINTRKVPTRIVGIVETAFRSLARPR